MWVDPVCRGQGVAKRFLDMAFEAWKDNILVTGFTPAAGGLYARSERFRDLPVARGMRAYLRSNLAEIVPRRQPKLGLLSPLLGVADGLANAVQGLRLGSPKTLPEDGPFRQLQDPDDPALATWVARCADAPGLSRRGPEDLRWMLRKPWVLEGPPDAEARRYHFTSHSPQFRQVLLLAEQPEPALLLLGLNKGLVKVPHAWVPESMASEALKAIIASLQTWGAHTLLCFEPPLVRALQASGPWLHRRPASHRFIAGRGLWAAMDAERPDLVEAGAGDAAFV